MQISILIPTYNRSQIAVLQVERLLSYRKIFCQKFPNRSFEIVVSDNHSFPPISSLIPECEGVRIISPEVHLPSGEQNLVFGIDHCVGEYTWVLADEDIPILDKMEELFDFLDKENPDFVVTSCEFIYTDGRFIKTRTLCSDPDGISSLFDFTSKVGIQSVMAGFSCLILRTALIKNTQSIFEAYANESKVYSHVFWILHIFLDKKFKYFNYPMVTYGQNKHDVESDHWARAASRESVFLNYFWTLGLLKLIVKFCHEKRLSLNLFSSIIETEAQKRSLLLLTIVQSYIAQIERDVSVRRDTLTMDSESSKHIVNLLMSIEPRMHFVFRDYIENGYSFNNQVISAIKSKSEMLRDYLNFFFVCHFGGWEIYKFSKLFCAVHSSTSENQRAEIFRDISPIDTSYLLVESSEISLKLKIRKKNEESSFISQPLTIAHSNSLNELTSRELSLLKKAVKAYDKCKRFLPQKIFRWFLK